MQQKVFNIKKILQEKDVQNQTYLSIHTILENQVSNLTNSIINQQNNELELHSFSSRKSMQELLQRANL